MGTINCKYDFFSNFFKHAFGCFFESSTPLWRISYSHTIIRTLYSMSMYTDTLIHFSLILKVADSSYYSCIVISFANFSKINSNLISSVKCYYKLSYFINNEYTIYILTYIYLIFYIYIHKSTQMIASTICSIVFVDWQYACNGIILKYHRKFIYAPVW